jgi:hypothetical protein
MSDCREEERRSDYPLLREMIGRIDERTLMILEGQKQLATIESVKHVSGRIDRHIKSHVSRGNLTAVWVGLGISSAVGLGGIILTAISVFWNKTP